MVIPVDRRQKTSLLTCLHVNCSIPAAMWRASPCPKRKCPGRCLITFMHFSREWSSTMFCLVFVSFVWHTFWSFRQTSRRTFLQFTVSRKASKFNWIWFFFLSNMVWHWKAISYTNLFLEVYFKSRWNLKRQFNFFMKYCSAYRKRNLRFTGTLSILKG